MTNRKTGMIRLGLTSAMALALTSCGQREARRCVDGKDVIVDDQYCQGPNPYPYRWYYGGNGFGSSAEALGSSGSGGEGAGE